MAGAAWLHNRPSEALRVANDKEPSVAKTHLPFSAAPPSGGGGRDPYRGSAGYLSPRDCPGSSNQAPGEDRRLQVDLVDRHPDVAVGADRVDDGLAVGITLGWRAAHAVDGGVEPAPCGLLVQLHAANLAAQAPVDRYRPLNAAPEEGMRS